jgi:hypothetical protein
LTDVEVQPHTLVQFPLLGVLPKHTLQRFDGGSIVVTLDGLEATLVKRYGLDIG